MAEVEAHYGSFPKCPHCGATFRDAWELGMEDDDVLEVECGVCDGPYIVSLSISYTYRSSLPALAAPGGPS